MRQKNRLEKDEVLGNSNITVRCTRQKLKKKYLLFNYVFVSRLLVPVRTARLCFFFLFVLFNICISIFEVEDTIFVHF